MLIASYTIRIVFNLLHQFKLLIIFNEYFINSIVVESSFLGNGHNSKKQSAKANRQELHHEQKTILKLQ